MSETEIKFFYIPVSGNGSCLFTSIRLCMELSYILNNLGNPIKSFYLDGHSARMLKASLTIRHRIVEWFRKYLKKEIPQLGNYNEGENARIYQRGDLLALEMVKNGKDVPEEGNEREQIILQYLLKMSMPTTWGSTPEYTAAACMTKKIINIWQRGDTGLFIINSINGGGSYILSSNDLFEKERVNTVNESNSSDKLNEAMLSCSESNPESTDVSQISIRSTTSETNDESEETFNLFFENNHYVPMMTKHQYNKLLQTYGIDTVKHIQPLL